MEIDVWLEELNLGFEYQGEHHYHNLDFREASLTYEGRDATKLKKCNTAGITLVYVPYWWDNTTTTLSNLIEETTSGFRELKIATTIKDN